MAQIDKLILNALDIQRLGGQIYSIVMDKLDNSDKKLEFLNYLNKNRNVIYIAPLFWTLFVQDRWWLYVGRYCSNRKRKTSSLCSDLQGASELVFLQVAFC